MFFGMKNTNMKDNENFEIAGNIDVTPNVAFLLTLRNSGYNNYTAIEDIVDNSLDTDVKSSNVRINIKQKSKQTEYEHIEICDDGCGMTKETIREAFRLGSLTGKDKGFDLGCYGTGLKSASLSMGRRFEVRTKSENEPFYIIEFDLDEMLEKNKYEIPVRVGSQSEYVEFMKEIHSKTGTIVSLLKLDNTINGNKSQFKDLLKTKLGFTFKFFIDEFNKHIFVDDEEVKSIDPMVRNEPDVTCIAQNERFEFDGNEFKFSIYNIEHTDEARSRDIGRNKPNAGMYIYRNSRMVGKALDLGIVGLAADGYGNGIRVEFFMNGECDELFGSTFTKMITEKNKSEINQSFRDTCANIIGTYTGGIMKVEKAKTRASGKLRKISEDAINQQNIIFSSINKNKFVDVDRKGINQKRETPSEKSEPTGIKRTFKGRKRNDEFTAWEMVSLGEFGPMFVPYKKGKMYVIQMNQDHSFWTNFLHDAPMDVKSVFDMYFVSQAIGLEKTTYYDDEEKARLMDEYNLQVSEQMRKLMTL